MASTDSSNDLSFKDYSTDKLDRVISLPNLHVESDHKMAKNSLGGLKTKHKEEPVATVTKQLMQYVTVRNIETETSYLQKDWATFVLKELLDNAWDWLNACYPAKKTEDKETRKIGTCIWVTSSADSYNKKLVHIAVRNSNVDQIPVFPYLEKTFDFQLWYSTKRYQHNMTAGSLGDALKRCLGMGYAAWTNDFDASETFEDRQWNEPIIIRYNEKEFRAFIKVDTSIPNIWVEINEVSKTRDIGLDTEVEVTLPVFHEKMWDEKDNWYQKLQKYFMISKIGKSRTTFEFYCGPENGGSV